VLATEEAAESSEDDGKTGHNVNSNLFIGCFPFQRRYLHFHSALILLKTKLSVYK
jgi:hypothetical protein